MKRVLIIVLLFVFAGFSYSFAPALRHGYHIRTVVIDAGHGGHDTGCLGGSAKEKNVALAVALRLGKMIEERYPDMNVIFTRKTDVFVELRERAAIANRNHADLFICVHCNSGNKVAYGVETYVMGLHKTDDNLNVSKRENASILFEKDYKSNYDGYDPNSPESNIIFNLYQNAYMEKSLTFASKVQAQAEEFGARYNRGVKQAGFLVLYKTTMPSVLVETGFLTNAPEEKFLDSDKGQATIASVIFRAFKEYKVDMEEGDRGGADTGKVSEATSNPEDIAQPKLPEINPRKTVTDSKSKEIMEKARIADSLANNRIDIKPEPTKTKPAPSIDARTDIKAGKPDIDSASSATEKQKPVINAVHDETPSVVKDKNPVKSPVSKTEKTNIENEKPAAEFFYTVQVGATPTITKEELRKFSEVEDMKVITSEDGKMQRITSGVFATYTQAVTAQKKLHLKGFTDAFVTPYSNGIRITIKEARAMGK